MKKRSRLIEVTITVDSNGGMEFEFYENETGDYRKHDSARDRIGGTISRAVGMELLDWAELMFDELDWEEKEDASGT